MGLEILIYFFACYSVTFALQQKFSWLDKKHWLLDKILECTICTGLYSGLAVYPLIHTKFQLSSPWVSMQLHPLEWFMFGLASSGFCYTLDEVLKFLEKLPEMLDREDDEILDEDS